MLSLNLEEALPVPTLDRIVKMQHSEATPISSLLVPLTEPDVPPPDLMKGGLLLPGFVARPEDGLYIDISLLESIQNFQHFVERVFTSNAFFAELDYPLFL